MNCLVTPSPGEQGSGPRVYVGGVASAITLYSVRAHFSQWGNVLDVYFPRSRWSPRYCFVTFDSDISAHHAFTRSPRTINGLVRLSSGHLITVDHAFFICPSCLAHTEKHSCLYIFITQATAAVCCSVLEAAKLAKPAQRVGILDVVLRASRSLKFLSHIWLQGMCASA